MTLQSLQRSREAVSVLRVRERTKRCLAAASPRLKVTVSGRTTSGPWGGRKESLQGRDGSVHPLVLCHRGTITKPWLVKSFG